MARLWVRKACRGVRIFAQDRISRLFTRIINRIEISSRGEEEVQHIKSSREKGLNQPPKRRWDGNRSHKYPRVLFNPGDKCDTDTSNRLGLAPNAFLILGRTESNR